MPLIFTELPKINVRLGKSPTSIPAIDITFPDGHEDSFVLNRHYSSEEERNAQELKCNFFGHLEKESSACVAVTGCLGQDDLEMTINSKHSGPSNMYILRKNGQLEMVESTFR